ncbi:hypothetical protein [Oceanithermus sp.]|uniref:hypothetical protein n=1 Tax=Oceanithermus sp. TaxID=2268145 RepID=UPI00257D0151|nr:hypothetical protein [Oceanithermus sp.]
MWAERVRREAQRLKVGRGFFEAQLLFADGSFLHFRHDPHTRWVQAWVPDTGGVAPGFVPRIERFRLNRRHLEVWFKDGSRLEVRLGALGTRYRVHE